MTNSYNIASPDIGQESQDGYVFTAYGWVEMRKFRAPAPLRCEGLISCSVTMHSFSREAHQELGGKHDMYTCDQCDAERIWG